jgi:hypothetical protein
MKNTKIAVALVLFVTAAAIVVHAQQAVDLFVPGTASGYFGQPQDQAVPFVLAVTVSGPATITVTYISGTVTDCCGINAGPNGVRYNGGAYNEQFPLQEKKGISWGWVNNADALIGVFVSQSRVNTPGFTAIDGTKAATRVGITPGGLFFIGTGKTFDVTEAGTLFLGINDVWVGDNGGGFNVEVSATVH